MLHIFKHKAGRRLSSTTNEETQSNASSDPADDVHSLSYAEAYILGHNGEDEVPVEETLRPKLSRQLSDILAERSCLCYLVQFLETKDALPLIKFWIDAESFRSAAKLCSTNGVLPTRRTLKRSVSSDGSLDGSSLAEEELDLHLEDLVEVDEAGQPAEGGGDKKTASLHATVISHAIRIYRKYLVSTSVSFIDIPATILSQISLALCDKDEIRAELFLEAQRFITDILERDFLTPFLDSVFYCKYTVDVLTSDDLRLADILHNDVILFYFMEFLEQEGVQTYLEFWMAAVNFRQNLLRRYDKQQAQADAMVLYEKYFSLQATASLHLSDRLRTIVESRICAVNDEPIVDAFELPVRIVEHWLERAYFPPFLKSTLFYRYLSELFAKINDGGKAEAKRRATSGPGHRRNHSEPKLSTLLAMETRTKRKTATGMHIDAQQLYDPDTLWQRSTHKGLSFGRVDAFGRYTRDFEPDPTAAGEGERLTAGTRLKKAVRRLVNLPEDKVQEEIAWQVAEMIVKDITSVTLNGGAGEVVSPPRTTT